MTKVPEPTFSKNIDIVTGHQGRPHITATQAGRRIAGIAGKGKYVLDCGKNGNEFSLVRDSSTQITIGSGDAIICGRHVSMEKSVVLPVKPGTQNLKRNIIVCLRVELADGTTDTDRASIVVIDGDETSGEPKDPPTETGSLLSGDTVVDMPLWRIPVNGSVLERGTWLDPTVLATISEIKSGIESDAEAAIARIKADIGRAKTDVAYLKEKTHSKTVTSTIWKDLEYTKRGITWDLGRSLGIKIEKSYVIRGKIENIIKITLIPVSSVTERMLEDKKIFPFYTEYETKYHDNWTALNYKNRDDTMCGVSFRVDLPYPMRTTTYEITGDWGYIENVPIRKRKHKEGWYEDTIEEVKKGGASGITCKKEKSYIDFIISDTYITGFLKHSCKPGWHDYKPASLTIREA